MTIRINETEKRKLNKLLQKSKLSVNVFFRKCIEQIEIKAPPSRDYKHLYTEINRIGYNINQIARLCNEGKNVLSYREELLFFMNELYKLLDEHL